MKPVRKSIFKMVTATVITSILLTTASAEGLCYSAAAAQEMNVAAAADYAAQNQEALSSDDYTVSDNANPDDVDPAQAESDNTSVISDINASLVPSVSAQDLQYSAGLAIVNYSKQFNGFKYVYGAASPKSGFDCSGLVYYVYGHMGYSLPRTAKSQFSLGTTVEKTNLQPGDLVFFATKGGHSITHVGIYIGDNMFIHAATKHQGVIVSNLGSAYWAKTMVGAKRIITPQTALQLAYNSQSQVAKI